MKYLIAVLSIGALLVVTSCELSFAQKKDARKEPVEKSKEQVERTKEVPKETPPPPPQHEGLREILSKYVGKNTNHGVLKKVTHEYFVFDDDGALLTHPMYTLHTIKVTKDEESGEERIDIRLVARD